MAVNDDLRQSGGEPKGGVVNRFIRRKGKRQIVSALQNVEARVVIILSTFKGRPAEIDCQALGRSYLLCS